MNFHWQFAEPVGSDFTNEPTRRLWCSVILNALRDAMTRNPTPPGRGSGSGVSELDQRRADDWFRHGGAGFRQVCLLAGVNADAIRRAYINGEIANLEYDV